MIRMSFLAIMFLSMLILCEAFLAYQHKKQHVAKQIRIFCRFSLSVAPQS